MARFDGHEVHIGDIVTFEHPDGSRIVREILPTGDGTDQWAGIAWTGVEKVESRTFVNWLVLPANQGGGWKITNVKHGEYKPFAAYVATSTGTTFG
jgi:hypothetical protein